MRETKKNIVLWHCTDLELVHIYTLQTMKTIKDIACTQQTIRWIASKFFHMNFTKVIYSSENHILQPTASSFSHDRKMYMYEEEVSQESSQPIPVTARERICLFASPKFVLMVLSE